PASAPPLAVKGGRSAVALPYCGSRNWLRVRHAYTAAQADSLVVSHGPYSHARTIANALDPAREIGCEGLVDTGAWGLMLPRAWKQRLGAFQMTRTVEMITADQRV